MTGTFITPAGIALTFSGTATGNTNTYIEGSSASGYTATGASRRILSLIHTGTLSTYQIDLSTTSISASGIWDGYLSPPRLATGSMDIDTLSGRLTATRIEYLGSQDTSLALSG